MAGLRRFNLGCASVALATALLLNLGAKKAPAPVGPTAEEIANARKQVVGAQHDVEQAQEALDKLADTKLRPQFESSSEWKDAQAELKDAQANRDEAVKPVLENLKKQKDYQAALKEKDDAAAEVAKLRKEGASTDDMNEAAQDSMKATDAVAKLESDAIAKDDKAKAAQERYMQAATKVGALKKKFADSVRNSPELASAKQALDDARNKRNEAQAALDELLRRAGQTHTRRRRHK